MKTTDDDVVINCCEGCGIDVLDNCGTFGELLKDPLIPPDEIVELEFVFVSKLFFGGLELGGDEDDGKNDEGLNWPYDELEAKEKASTFDAFPAPFIDVEVKYDMDGSIGCIDDTLVIL